MADEPTITIKITDLPDDLQTVQALRGLARVEPANDWASFYDALANNFPTVPLPTTPWSVVRDDDGDYWVLDDRGLWRCGVTLTYTAQELEQTHGPITVMHDTGTIGLQEDETHAK